MKVMPSDSDQRFQPEHDNAELARSNRELEQFAYVASHDLKSPLLVVDGFLELLERTKGDQLDEDAQMYVTAARRGAARMGRLIDDLLTYSRAGSNEHDRAWVDLTGVIDDVLESRAAEIREAKVEVLVGRLPQVMGSESMLRQLFDNLLSNAVKFRREDVDTVVEIDAVEVGGSWLFRVTDNGLGIPHDDRASIFTMFTRLGSTIDRGGSGIGLAICDRVVAAHGGRIWVEDGCAGGAQLCFTLPA